jgi:hypothetical protein
MTSAPESISGLSFEWQGVHHSREGDFGQISTHTVTYESDTHNYVTVGGKVVGQGAYEYTRLDDEVGVIIYQPEQYLGRRDVRLHAILNFAASTDRAVIEQSGKAFAVADGSFRLVATPREVPS